MEQTGAECRTAQLFPEFSSVPPEQVATIWPFIEDMIERALAHGYGSSPDEIRAAIERGEYLLWLVHYDGKVTATVVVSVKKFSTGQKISVELLAGKNMYQWAEQLQQVLVDFKDITGSQYIEATCRRGLARKLTRLGWSERAVIMRLDE